MGVGPKERRRRSPGSRELRLSRAPATQSDGGGSRPAHAHWGTASRVVTFAKDLVVDAVRGADVLAREAVVHNDPLLAVVQRARPPPESGYFEKTGAGATPRAGGGSCGSVGRRGRLDSQRGTVAPGGRGVAARAVAGGHRQLGAAPRQGGPSGGRVPPLRRRLAAGHRRGAAPGADFAAELPQQLSQVVLGMLLARGAGREPAGAAGGAHAAPATPNSVLSCKAAMLQC